MKYCSRDIAKYRSSNITMNDDIGRHSLSVHGEVFATRTRSEVIRSIQISLQSTKDRYIGLCYDHSHGDYFL